MKQIDVSNEMNVFGSVTVVATNKSIVYSNSRFNAYSESNRDTKVLSEDQDKGEKDTLEKR